MSERYRGARMNSGAEQAQLPTFLERIGRLLSRTARGVLLSMWILGLTQIALSSLDDRFVSSLMVSTLMGSGESIIFSSLLFERVDIDVDCPHASQVLDLVTYKLGDNPPPIRAV